MPAPSQAHPAGSPTTTTIAGLKDLVGKVLGPSGWRTITQEQVTQFADLTGDHNPVHVDAAFASGTPFGTTITHGYFTLSLVVPLMDEILKVSDLGTGINYGLDRLRFPAPVPVGSRIRVSCVVTTVDDIKGGVQAHITSTFEVAGSAKPAAVAEMLIRYYT